MRRPAVLYPDNGRAPLTTGGVDGHRASLLSVKQSSITRVIDMLLHPSFVASPGMICENLQPSGLAVVYPRDSLLPLTVSILYLGCCIVLR